MARHGITNRIKWAWERVPLSQKMWILIGSAVMAAVGIVCLLQETDIPFVQFIGGFCEIISTMIVCRTFRCQNKKYENDRYDQQLNLLFAGRRSAIARISFYARGLYDESSVYSYIVYGSAFFRFALDEIKLISKSLKAPSYLREFNAQEAMNTFEEHVTEIPNINPWDVEATKDAIHKKLRNQELLKLKNQDYRITYKLFQRAKELQSAQSMSVEEMSYCIFLQKYHRYISDYINALTPILDFILQDKKRQADAWGLLRQQMSVEELRFLDYYGLKDKTFKDKLNTLKTKLQ